MNRHKMVDGERIEFTAEENAEWDAMAIAWQDGANDRVLVQVRELRNKHLADSDYKLMPDVAEESREAWKVYRQALRDLPEVLKSSNITEMSEVVWPVAP